MRANEGLRRVFLGDKFTAMGNGCVHKGRWFSHLFEG